MGPQCVICLCDFTNPVCIPCGHVFCSECLNKFIAGKNDSAGDGFKATCPFCREKFPIAIPNLRYLPEKFHPFVVDPLRKVFITSDNSEKLELVGRIENLEKEILDLKQGNANLESERDQLQEKCAEAERSKQDCLDENRRLSADCTIAKAQASICGSRVKKQAKKLDELKRLFGMVTDALEKDDQSGWSHRTLGMSIGLPREFNFNFIPHAISNSTDSQQLSQPVSDGTNASETAGLLQDLTLGGTDAPLIPLPPSTLSTPNPTTALAVTTEVSRLEAMSG